MQFMPKISVRHRSASNTTLPTHLPQMTFPQMHNGPSQIILVSILLTKPLHCTSSTSLLGTCIEAYVSIALPELLGF